jgi:hypothetical protein
VQTHQAQHGQTGHPCPTHTAQVAGTVQTCGMAPAMQRELPRWPGPQQRPARMCAGSAAPQAPSATQLDKRT